MASTEKGAGPDPDHDLSLHHLSMVPGQPVAAHRAMLPSPDAGFTFVRQIGCGGMGVVYEALESATGRRVALKVMGHRLSQTADGIERFKREARLAASISHPRCVFVYGAHEVHGAAAISMELMTGQTLDDRLKSGERIPVKTAIGWTIEVLEGLEAAHEVGVIHRDVKPSNCFLTTDGHVKVGDFGLSRSIEGDLALTESGAFIGSPLYSSPEQARGWAVDARSDVYSVGATLYALLVGRPPHDGLTLLDVLARIVSEDAPTVRSVRPDVPASLSKIIARSLARNPAERFQDCASFWHELIPYGPRGLTPATLGLRVGAFMLDSFFISIACSLVSAALLREFAITIGSPISLGFGDFFGCSERAYEVDVDGRLSRSPPGLELLIRSAFALAWFALFEALTGATPGKWWLGLRVLDASGSRPPLWRTTIRSTVFLAPYVLAQGLGETDLYSLALTGAYVLPLITMRPRNGFRGVHEILSGTRVLRVLSRSPSPDAAAFDVARESTGTPSLIGSYAVTGVVGATPHGTLVSGRDPALNREVWLHIGKLPDGLRRAGDTPGAVRWLHRCDEPVAHDVYEAPGGGSLREWVTARGPLSWSEACTHLIDLADELQERGDRTAIEQIWIDRKGRLRVFDFPIGKGVACEEPLDCLTAAARLMLQGTQRATLVPDGLPLYPKDPASRLLGVADRFATLAEARSALEKVVGRATKVSGYRRALQILLAGYWLGCGRALESVFGTPELSLKSLAGATVVGLAPIVMAHVLSGGLTFSILRIGLRDQAGNRASRLRCALRSAVVWLPPSIAMAVSPLVRLPLSPLGVIAVVYAVGAIWSLLKPTRGPVDLIAGTGLVRT